jgi:hypothetical protein
MVIVDFSPYVSTVENSPLEPRLKRFILDCFQLSKTGTLLDPHKFAANISIANLEDHAAIKAYLSVLFKPK